MISYENNPNIKVRVVTTFKGDKEYRQNCKHIIDRTEKIGKYYKIGRDCFEFDGKWYRVDSGYITFDHEKKVWCLKTNRWLQHGIVGFDKDEPIIGHFTANKFNNVSVYEPETDTNYACINVDLLKEQKGYLENINNGTWFVVKNAKSKTSSWYRNLRNINGENNYKNKGYNIEDNGREFVEKIENFKNYPTAMSRETRIFGRLLGDTTFGAEVELAAGFIPDWVQQRMGIVMCRDGSITGGEAVTIPMSGAKGLQNLKDIATNFAERAIIDINCSYHLHVGNIPTDRAYLCSLYVLAYKIQNEVFTMFPYYKTKPEGFKKKNYCKKLAKMQIHPLKDKSKEGYESFINDTYERIFMFLSDGVSADQFNNKKQMKHPIPNKWDRPSRYYWINLQNMIFSPRKTAEFRIHQATLNPQKMTLWLFMCNAIVRYAQTHQEEILMTDAPISFIQVLRYYADEFKGLRIAQEMSNHLIGYFEERRKTFDEDLKREDYLSDKDSKEDKQYVFQNPLF